MQKLKKIVSIYCEKLFLGILLVFFSANFLIWGSLFENLKKSDIEIYFFDVGQGDSSLIETRDGTQILIDGGPPNKILPKLSRVLDFNDRDLDVLVLTHPHTDHVSGAIEVLKNYNVGMVVESGAAYNTAEAGEFRKLVNERIKTGSLKRVVVDKQLTLSFFEGAKLRFLYPDKSFEGAILKNVHDSTLVSELSYGAKKFLFMGDAEKNIERYLVNKNLVDDIDVLKVGHHGSKTSSITEFLSLAKPEYAVIQVGKNRYGHPTQEVLSRLASTGSKVFRTDRDGTIKFEVDSLGNLKFSVENIR